MHYAVLARTTIYVQFALSHCCAYRLGPAVVGLPTM